MAVSRNQLHYVVMTVIYDELVDFYHGDGKVFRDASVLISELCECDFEECDDYIKNVVSYSLNKYGEIKEAYSKHLVKWKWERLPLLTQAILLMSYVHFYYVEKADKRVVINIAVDLAKKYVDEKQPKFINAILDKVLE